MRATGFVWVVLLLAGCRGGEDNNSILAAGTQAIVVEENGGYITEEGASYPRKLAPGVRVAIGHDGGVWQQTERDVQAPKSNPTGEELAKEKAGPKRYTYPDGMASIRPVKVVVESGEFRGMSGSVTRNDLRPAPK